MSKKQEETDPWLAQVKVVNELLSEQHINVPNQFSGRQIKRFAQMEALSYLHKKYLLRVDGEDLKNENTWVDILMIGYKTMLKAHKGWAVKLASKVAAAGSQMRMMLNLQRRREILVGGET